MENYLRELVEFLCDWLERVSAEPGFWSGVVLGVVGFAIAAFAVFTVRVWWGNVTAPFRPQTVTHTTNATPAQITRSSCRSLVWGLLVFAVIVCVLIEILFPGVLLALWLTI